MDLYSSSLPLHSPDYCPNLVALPTVASCYYGQPKAQQSLGLLLDCLLGHIFGSHPSSSPAEEPSATLRTVGLHSSEAEKRTDHEMNSVDHSMFHQYIHEHSH